jgi:HK97 family phage portal protein
MLLKADTVLGLQAKQRAMVEPSARSRTSAVRERSHSDEAVTVDTAVTVSGVISIITLLSQDMSSIPLLLYARRGRNKFRAFDNPYYVLMHDQPNPEMSSMTFRELIVSHIIAWGNFYAQKVIDDRGNVRELWPLRPDRMRVERVDGQKVYIYQPASGGKPIVFLMDEVLHFPGFGFDGLVGYSKIALARNAIGLALSLEKFGSKFFSNGANPGILYRHPGALSDKAYLRLQDDLKERSGVEQSHKPFILEEGMDISKIGLPPDDSQFLESRSFQLAEINRIIGPVPPHLIGDLEKSTSWGTGIDSQEQGYINHSLFPISKRIEQALDNQLLLSSDREQGFFYEHLFEGFLRGDIATRYAAYQTGINNGFMTRNEVRERENLNPRKGLDVLLMPLNMTTINDSGSVDGNGQESTDVQAHVFEPLWRDAIARVLKRESNDVSGASKRWQVKGQDEAYADWLDQFYTVDHPAFMQKQFKPIIDATQRLFHTENLETDMLIHEFLSERNDQVKGMSAKELEDGMQAYIAAASEKYFAVMNAPMIFGTFEEIDYD